MHVRALTALLIALAPACNSTDYRNALDIRYFSSELDQPDWNELSEPSGYGLAFTSLPRGRSVFPVGVELGAGRQDDDAGSSSVDVEELWAGVYSEFGEQVVRLLLGAGVLHRRAELNPMGLEGDDTGLYAQVGVRVLATQRTMVSVGYRASFALDGTFGGERDLDAEQVFFSVGFGF